MINSQFTFQWAFCAEENIEIIIQRVMDFKPQVILLDNYFPMDQDFGIKTVLPKLTQAKKHPPIIVMTAHRGKGFDPVLVARDLGVHKFVDKQTMFDDHYLMTLVEKILQKLKEKA
jgi:response regulator of citrate/malate metabolism